MGPPEVVWIGRDDAPVTTAPTTPPPDGTDDEVLALADRLFRAIEAADLETVRACWSEDAVLWTNFSGARDRETSLSVLRWLTTKMPDLSYEITRRERVAGGFLQQQDLEAVGQRPLLEVELGHQGGRARVGQHRRLEVGLDGLALDGGRAARVRQGRGAQQRTQQSGDFHGHVLSLGVTRTAPTPSVRRGYA